MKPAMKIELYDASVVLRHIESEQGLAYVGWGYSEELGGWAATEDLLTLLREMFSFSDNVKASIDAMVDKKLYFPLVRRLFEQDIKCISLEAEETRDGTLLIRGTIQVKDITKKQEWDLNVSYRGDYTVYGAIE